METKNTCYDENKYREIHIMLKEARLTKMRSAFVEREKICISLPPDLLPQNASDSDKEKRWQEIVDWAKEYGFDGLIKQ